MPPKDPYNPPHNPTLAGTPMLGKQRFTAWAKKNRRSKRCLGSNQQETTIDCFASDLPDVPWSTLQVVLLIMDTIYNLVSLRFDFLNAFCLSALRENERVNVEKIKLRLFPQRPPTLSSGVVKLCTVRYKALKPSTATI
jgi:hypothetical protein